MAGRNIYLGVRVKDIGRKGLSHATEIKRIADKIYDDYKKHRISRNTARGRLLLLYKLSFKKNNSRLVTSGRGLAIIRKYIRNLMSRI